jgi:hypothetical protein
VPLQRIQQSFEDFRLRKLLNVKIVSFYEELKVPEFGLVINSHPQDRHKFDCLQVVNDRAVLAKQFARLPLHANHEVMGISLLIIASDLELADL